MTEQRLKVESGPPAHMFTETDAGAEAPPSHDDGAASDRAKDKAQAVAAPAIDKAQAVAAPAIDKAQAVAAPAKEKARDVAAQAKVHAQAAAGQAKDKAAAQVDERSTQLGQQIGAHAQSLDGVAEELRRQGKDGPAKIAEQAGQRVKDVGDYLERTDGESLVGVVRDVAREHPAAAAAASAAAGFVAGRVLKASQADAADEGGDESARAADGGP
jgi:F0F1-type ATP synthase membrane subunit b/b'